MRIPGITPAPIVAHAQAHADVMADYFRRFSKPPTPEEFTRGTRYALEAWPEELHTLSVPSAGFQLTPAEREILPMVWGEFPIRKEYASAYALWHNAEEAVASMRADDGTALLELPVIAQLIARTTDFIATLPFSEPFFKLGTRSPKDSDLWTASSGRVRNGFDVILLAMSSARFFQDCANAQNFAEHAAGKDPFEASMGPSRWKGDPNLIDYLPWFWFREFRAFPKHSEFRCFMLNRTFAGGSQYHGINRKPNGPLLEVEAFPELVMRGYDYEAAIKAWFPRFEAVAPFDDAVFDVSVDLQNDDTVILIETNPADKATFPGLKDWNAPESFNGEVDWAADSWRNPEIRIDAAALRAEPPRP